MYSLIVFKDVNLILWKENIYLRKNWLIFWGILGEVELILRIWGAKRKYFQGAGEFSFRNLGDQCIIFKDQGGLVSFL